MRLLPLSLLLFSSLAEAIEPAGLDRVAAYAGTWKTEARHVDSLYSKAGSESHLLRNDCWRSEGFYVCDQIVDGKSAALLVFTYDEKTGTYSSYPIPAGGAPVVHPGTLLIQGAIWTFPWDNIEGGKTVHFRVVNTWSSADRIEFRQEYSADGVHWTLMADGHDTRVADSVKP